MRSAISHKQESEDTYFPLLWLKQSPLAPCTKHAEECFLVHLCCCEPRLSHRPRYTVDALQILLCHLHGPGHGEAREQGHGGTQGR